MTERAAEDHPAERQPDNLAEWAIPGLTEREADDFMQAITDRGDHPAMRQVCACSWDGDHCPHCGRTVAVSVRDVDGNGHMDRCHVASVGDDGVSDQNTRGDHPASRYPAFDPDWVVPTSELLRECLDDTRLGLRPFVAAGGVPREGRDAVMRALADVLDGDAPLTDDLAAVVARATGTPARVWIAFEHNYREGLAAGKKVIGADD